MRTPPAHAHSHAAASPPVFLLLNTAKGERCLHFTCAYIHAHTHTRAYVQHAYTHAHAHICTHTDTHTHAHTHTHTHTCRTLSSESAVCTPRIQTDRYRDTHMHIHAERCPVRAPFAALYIACIVTEVSRQELRLRQFLLKIVLPLTARLCLVARLHLPMHACVPACVHHLLICRPWPSRYVSMHACM